MGVLFDYLLAVKQHWLGLATGSALVVLIGALEHRRTRSISWRLYAVFLGLCLFWATFQTWTEQRELASVLKAENGRLIATVASRDATIAESEKRISDYQAMLHASEVRRQCSGAIHVGEFTLSNYTGLIASQGSGILEGSSRRKFRFDFSDPPFTPEVPIIVRLYSKEPIRVTRIDRIP